MIKVYVTGRYSAQVISLKNAISNNYGLQWEVVNQPENAQIILFFDCLDEHLFKFSVKKILVRQEPKLVLPEIYNLNKLSNFDLVINVGKPQDENIQNINWPQKIRLPLKNFTERYKYKSVLINSNLLSFHIDEMYSLRRDLCFNSDNIDLFGYGWNISLQQKLKIFLIELRKFIIKPQPIKIKGLKYFFRKPKNYKGTVEDKILTMQKYQTSVVIENCSSYVSEKLFDSFSAGCIPIYIGPDLERYDIPKNLYIQAEPNRTSILSAIEKAKRIDYSVWLEELEVWFRSEDCIENWSEETFLIRLKTLINYQ